MDNSINKDCGVSEQGSKARAMIDVDLSKIESGILMVAKHQAKTDAFLMSLSENMVVQGHAMHDQLEVLKTIHNSITVLGEILLRIYPELVEMKDLAKHTADQKSLEVALMRKKEFMLKDTARTSEAYKKLLSIAESQQTVPTSTAITACDVSTPTALKLMRLLANDFPDRFKFYKCAGNNPAFLSKRTVAMMDTRRVQGVSVPVNKSKMVENVMATDAQHTKRLIKRLSG